MRQTVRNQPVNPYYNSAFITGKRILERRHLAGKMPALPAEDHLRKSVSASTSFFLALRLFYRRLGIMLTANVLWIVSSLPLVTLPAATGALFYLAHRLVLEERQRDPHYARTGDFWIGFRLYGWRSTWLFLLQLAAFAIIAAVLRFYWTSPLELLRWLAGPVFLILIVWLGVQIYLFPLLIVFPEQSTPAIIRRAFIYVITYPLYTLLLLVWMVLLTVICLVLAGPVLLVLFALLALIQTVALRVLRVAHGEIEQPKS